MATKSLSVKPDGPQGVSARPRNQGELRARREAHARARRKIDISGCTELWSAIAASVDAQHTETGAQQKCNMSWNNERVNHSPGIPACLDGTNNN